MLQKGFVPILIVLVLAAALGGYFYFQKSQSSPTTPTPPIHACSPDSKVCSDGSHVGRIPPNCDFAPCPVSDTKSDSTSSAKMVKSDYSIVDTGNEKGYEDRTLGFSFIYSNEWKLDACTKSCLYQGELSLTSNIQTNIPSLNYWIKVYLKKNIAHKNFTDLFTESYDSGSKKGFIYSTEKINNLSAYRTTGILGQVGTITVAFLTKDGNYIVFVLTPYSETKPDLNQSQAYSEFNQILSTFKFLP